MLISHTGHLLNSRMTNSPTVSVVGILIANSCGLMFHTLSITILDYGLVKTDRTTNLVWHYFRKFCASKLAVKLPTWIPCGCKVMFCVWCSMYLQIRTVKNMSQWNWTSVNHRRIWSTTWKPRRSVPQRCPCSRKRKIKDTMFCPSVTCWVFTLGFWRLLPYTQHSFSVTLFILVSRLFYSVVTKSSYRFPDGGRIRHQENGQENAILIFPQTSWSEQNTVWSFRYIVGFDRTPPNWYISDHPHPQVNTVTGRGPQSRGYRDIWRHNSTPNGEFATTEVLQVAQVHSESEGDRAREVAWSEPLLVFFPVNTQPHYTGTDRIEAGEFQSRTRLCNWESSVCRLKVHLRNSTTFPKGHHHWGRCDVHTQTKVWGRREGRRRQKVTKSVGTKRGSVVSLRVDLQTRRWRGWWVPRQGRW